MRAVVFAYQNIGCAGLKALKKHGFDIAGVFTHKDDPSENIWFDSVAELAASMDVPVFAPDDVNHPIWVRKISEMKPDVIFSFYYRKMLKKEILDIPAKGGLNLHGSLLPRYRGRCPANWVLVNGEKETGVTLHYMTPKPDEGDIVAQEKVAITKEDNAFSLYGKMVATSEKLLDGILPAVVDGTAPRIPQDNSKATYFGGRTPADGEIDWTKSAEEVANLVRAVARPYPGAFTFAGDRRLTIWEAVATDNAESVEPGVVISLNPFIVACGKGALKVDKAQPDGEIFMSGRQTVLSMGITDKMELGKKHTLSVSRKTSVLILGVNGFIGNALSERLLETGRFVVHGMDLFSDKIGRLLEKKDFFFDEGDISIHREWIEYHVRKCDVILPLVAIATPIEYTRNPIRVFNLDFEENLRVVRYCVKYQKRIVFPSTSEVYGMCDEPEFDEDNSRLILGPIRMQRWIYSCSKQLLDRVIWAYGKQEGLKFSLFRPFNWIGPRLDSLDSARIGSSRAITQLILNLVEGSPIRLVDGGRQKRCFTDVKDGVECLYRIIEDKNNNCNGQIFNIGNPKNEAGIKELAEILVEKFDKHPLRSQFPAFAGMHEVESSQYYGSGYQDVEHRKPSVKKAFKLLGWEPEIGLEQSVDETLDFFLKQAVK